MTAVDREVSKQQALPDARPQPVAVPVFGHCIGDMVRYIFLYRK
jgi:hypothetical protein